MKLAYVAGPYRAPTMHQIVDNIRAAEAVAIALWQMGFAVVCPHTNTACFDGTAPDQVWLEGDLEILRRCDLLVTVSGWERSEGATIEVREANSALKPVYHWPEDEELLRDLP
jgi:hypothetical protein